MVSVRARAVALVNNFADQWLYLRNLKNQIPNSVEFPDFDDNLRQAFRRETELHFETMLRESRASPGHNMLPAPPQPAPLLRWRTWPHRLAQ